MNTQVLPIDAFDPEPERIERAADILRRGGLVAFPTETVYGLGASALDERALGRIFAAKQRPKSDPIIAHLARAEQLLDLAIDVPDEAWHLAERFWPGPLTLILKRHPHVPAAIAEGRATIAVRTPAHPIAHALLAAAGLPIGAPSANRFMRPSATTAQHVLEDLEGRIDCVIDGGRATMGVESTVIDLTGPAPVVLRPGGVTLDDLESVLPSIAFAPARVTAEEGHQAPGQMLKHYSPRADVRLFRGPDQAAVFAAMHRMADEERTRGLRVGALLTREVARHAPGTWDLEDLGAADDAEAQAHNLFAAMRRLDARGVDVILVHEPEAQGLGLALADRLLRAAEGVVIDV